MDRIDSGGIESLLGGEHFRFAAEHVIPVAGLVVHERGQIRGLGTGAAQLVDMRGPEKC